MDWYNDEIKEIDKVTVEEFEGLVDTIAKQRDVCDGKKEELKEENRKLAVLEEKAVLLMKKLGRTNYKGLSGTMYIGHRLSVKVPAGDENRSKFFDYLKGKGIFDRMITVNSNTLNSYYKTEHEKAEADGKLSEFKIPGIDEPTIVERLNFKRSK